MDPFRDELAAAHSKIAQLEEQLREEQASRHGPTDAQVASAQVTRIAIALVFLGLVVGLGAFVFLIRSRSASLVSAPGPASYRGVATATAHESNAGMPTDDSRSTRSAGTVSSKPCNCTPGDPLCSCL